MVRLGVLLLVVSSFSACATMSEQECLSGDWQTVGFEDGSRGKPLNRIEKHAKACGSHGIEPDLAGYKVGRDQGLQHYCTVANGFYVGARGGEYKNVCPEDLEDQFVAAFQDGQHLYRLESDLQSIDGEAYAIKERVEKLEHTQAAIEAELLDDATDKPRRFLLLEQSKDLAKEIGFLQSQLIVLYQDRGVAQERLVNYRAELRYQ